MAGVDESMDTSDHEGVQTMEVEDDARPPSPKGKQKRVLRADGQEKNLPWVEKYRPKELSDLIAHEDIISTINRLIDAQRLPHLLFYGPPGTGKTSAILATARRMYGPNFSSMVLELNASDDRGIDIVRNQIKEFAGTKKLFSSGIKLIILDEADAMTSDAQFSLRRVIEKYTKNARFCLICNYVSKIIPALQSRCTRFRFSPLRPQQITSRLRYVIEQEGVNVTSDGFEAILRLGQGDMRKILNILQSTAMAYDTVNEVNVCLCTGTPQPQDLKRVLDSLLNKEFDETYNFLRDMMVTNGYALTDIVKEVAALVMRLELPPKALGYLINELSNVEYRLAFATTEKLQLGSLVGAFTLARDMIEVPAP